MHQRIAPQSCVVDQDLIPSTQGIQPLGKQIVQCVGYRLRESDPTIYLLKQHQTTVRTRHTSFKIRFDQTTTNAPKRHQPSGTVWHRRNFSQYGFKNLY